MAASLLALVVFAAGCGGKPDQETKPAGQQASKTAEQEELAFYNGKTVTYIVATKPGGGYDTYARLIAPHLQKQLPGSTVIVKNVPGAGQIIGANEVYNAKPDGLTIGTLNKGLIMSQIAGMEGIKFDMTKFTWLGDASTEPRALVVGVKTPFKSMEDLKKAREVKLASAGIGTTSHSESLMLSKIFGFNAKVIAGYGGQDADLAMMRGEVDAQIGALASMKGMIDNNEARAILLIGQKGDQLKDVPLLSEVAPAGQKTLADLLTAQASLSRPIAATPGIPEGRAKVLREALKKAIEDPDLLAKARQAKLPVEYVSAGEVSKHVTAAFNQPPEIKAIIKEIVGSGEGKN